MFSAFSILTVVLTTAHSDRLPRSIWSVRGRRDVGDILTSDVHGREVRNKKRHFTVSGVPCLGLPSLTVLALQYSKVRNINSGQT